MDDKNDPQSAYWPEYTLIAEAESGSSGITHFVPCPETLYPMDYGKLAAATMIGEK